MYDGFFELDAGGNLVPKASLVGELDMWWELDGDGNLIPRASAVSPVFPAATSVLPRAGVYGWSGEYVGNFAYPPANVVKRGYPYGAAGVEFLGTYGTDFRGGTIRERIRDAGARCALRAGQRLGFVVAYKSHETGETTSGLVAVDISSDEARSIFGSDVDGLSRTIEIPRQIGWPPDGGIKVNSRVLITEGAVTKAYALDRVHYATAKISDAATINLLLRRWDDTTVELDA